VAPAAGAVVGAAAGAVVAAAAGAEVADGAAGFVSGVGADEQAAVSAAKPPSPTRPARPRKRRRLRSLFIFRSFLSALVRAHYHLRAPGAVVPAGGRPVQPLAGHAQRIGGLEEAARHLVAHEVGHQVLDQ